MSKLKQIQTLAEYGPDATRWYMISNATWDNLKFDEGIAEVRRKFLAPCITSSFFSLYANIDGFKYDEAEIPLKERPEIDQWIISELNTLIKDVDKLTTSLQKQLVLFLISVQET
jgi:isoleucyl-tRNA synthetase